MTVSCRKCLLTRLTVLLLWSGGLLWLSLVPSPPSPPFDLFSWDKLQHVAAYALLTVLIGRFFAQWRPLSRHPWIYALVAAVVFGGLVEILQGILTESRRAEWSDLLANSIGGILVVSGATALKYRQRRKSKP